MGHYIRVPLNQGKVIQQVLNTPSHPNLTELCPVDPKTMYIQLRKTISHDLLNSHRWDKQILMRLPMLPTSAQIGQYLNQMFLPMRVSIRIRSNNRNPI